MAEGRATVLPARPRLSGALAVSGVAHALVAAALVATHIEPPPTATPVRVFPVALVARLGGGGGDGALPDAPAPPAAEPAPPPPVAPAPKPRVAKAPRPSRPKPAPPSESIASIAPQGHATETSAVPPPGSGTGGPGEAGGGGHGGGVGGGSGGGDGTGGARVAYGTNPLPPYPLAARRLGMEGVTLLDVLVAPDGKPVDVRVEKSSGFAPLDDSALKTVRERWRFVPAREGGTPVESRVTVPIRFRLSAEGG